MHIKLIPPGSYDFDEPAMTLVKRARYRMGANDRRALLKRASAEFVDRIARLEPRRGEELAHNIALSTTEAVGPNRNADGFKEADCRKYHNTFVKYGYAYRNHQNRDPKKSYGKLKLSHFNEDMQRIELAIAYNATKEAADRNGNLVADLELEKLAAGLPFPTSMACLVAFDVCSGCGNKAKTRADYCHGSMCKYGGLRDHIGEVFADGHHLHADNPNPRWFDLSHIVGGRGADRTSFTLGRVKAACERMKCGSELAEELGLEAPAGIPLFDGPLAPYMKAASDLSATLPLASVWASAFAPQMQPPLLDLPDLQSHSEKLGRALKALADERVILPPRDFLAILVGDPKTAADTAAQLAPHIPAAYDSLLVEGEAVFSANPYVPTPGPVPYATQQWARKLAADYGLSRTDAQRRATIAAMRDVRPRLHNVMESGSMEKAAGAKRALARQYALYKVAALRVMADSPDYDWLLAMAATQDRALI